MLSPQRCPPEIAPASGSSPLHSYLSTPAALSTQPAPQQLNSIRTLATRASAEDSPTRFMTTDIQNLKTFDPFAEAEDSVGETKTTSQNYIHIRIQREFPILYAPPSHARSSSPLCLAALLTDVTQSAMVVRR